MRGDSSPWHLCITERYRFVKRKTEVKRSNNFFILSPLGEVREHPRKIAEKLGGAICREQEEKSEEGCDGEGSRLDCVAKSGVD
jgi:hypothetical protein